MCAQRENIIFCSLQRVLGMDLQRINLCIKMLDLNLSLALDKRWTIGVVVRMSILDTNVDGSIPSINMFSPWARDFIRIASVDSAVKWVPGGDNLVKGVQCYELFGGIALKIHTFSFFHFFILIEVDRQILWIKYLWDESNNSIKRYSRWINCKEKMWNNWSLQSDYRW